MGRVNRYTVPNTYEKEFAYNEGDWRGWEDITQEEIDIAKSNGIHIRLLYARVETNMMPIRRAITKPLVNYNGRVISKENGELLREKGINRDRVYQIMKRGKTFEETIERIEYLDNFKKYKQIALENGVRERQFRERMVAGWNFEEASSKIGRRKMTNQQRELMKQLGISSRIVYYHIRQGKTFDEVVQYVLKKRGVLSESKS